MLGVAGDLVSADNSVRLQQLQSGHPSLLGRIMGLLRLTRDLPTQIEMRRLEGGQLCLLSHYSAPATHTYGENTEDRRGGYLYL